MNTLQQAIEKAVYHSNNVSHRATLEKIAIYPTQRPAGIMHRYALQIATRDKQGKQALLRHYDTRKLGAIEPAQNGDFILWLHCSYRIPAKIDCIKLAAIFDAVTCYTPEIMEAYNCITEAARAAWITNIKQAAKEKNHTEAARIIKAITNADFISNTGDLIGCDWRFSVDHNTITKLMQNIGIDPRQNADFIARTIESAHRDFIAGYNVRMISEPDEIEKIYAQHDDFSSCMRGLATPARIYQPYRVNEAGEPMQSLALHVIEKNGEFIGRFIARLKSRKYPTLYTDWQTSKIEAVLDALGYERNPSAFYGARLPLVKDDSERVYMPYIDGDKKAIRYVKTDAGEYLQIDGIAGEEIGAATGTRGYLITNGSAWTIGGFRDAGSRHDYSDYRENDEDDHEDEFYCEHCNEWHDMHYHNTVNDSSICDGCLSESFTTCEDCEEYIETDEANYIEVYDIHAGNSEHRSLCECCINDYWQEPSEGNLYFSLKDIRRYALGL